MSRIRVSGASGSSENTIVFIPSGGHSHDGITSSLISTEKYSIYDFSPSFVNSNQSQTRAVRQENNRLAFESLVVSIVNQSVLVPAGIRLDPGSLNGSTLIANTVTAVHIAANTITADEISANTITADQIASNTITADELVSNIVLVNNIIRSNVYTPGSAGWKISNDGTAEFSNVIVRGNIYSNVGTIGGWTISSTSLASGTGSTTLYSNGAAVIGNTTIAANGRITNGNFAVSNTGVLTATGADISGVITSTSGSIGGWLIDSSGIYKGFGGNTTRLSSFDSTLNLWNSGSENTSVQPGYMIVTDGSTSTQINAGRIDTTDIFTTNFSATSSINASKFIAADLITDPFKQQGSFTYIGNGCARVTNSTTVYNESIASGRTVLVGSGGSLGTSSSSRRFKTNILPASFDKNDVLKITPVTFDYNNLVSEDKPGDRLNNLGLIAEDLDKTSLSFLVGYDDEGLPAFVRYELLALTLVGLIKDHESQIEAFKLDIQQLKAKIDILEAK